MFLYGLKLLIAYILLSNRCRTIRTTPNRPVDMVRISSICFSSGGINQSEATCFKTLAQKVQIQARHSPSQRVALIIGRLWHSHKSNGTRRTNSSQKTRRTDTQVIAGSPPLSEPVKRIMKAKLAVLADREILLGALCSNMISGVFRLFSCGARLIVGGAAHNSAGFIQMPPRRPLIWQQRQEEDMRSFRDKCPDLLRHDVVCFREIARPMATIRVEKPQLPLTVIVPIRGHRLSPSLCTLIVWQRKLVPPNAVSLTA
jgi:hypothetical protein